MHEIEILLICRWKELEHDMIHKQNHIDIMDYMFNGDYPSLPDEDEVIYKRFVEGWFAIRASCEPTMAKNIETVFLVKRRMYNEGAWDGRGREDDLPPNPRLDVWMQIICGVSPKSVLEIAEVTTNLDLESYIARFQPVDDFWDAQAFRNYSQAWLNHFNLAAANNSGILILRM